jgi:hypothetical protein
MNITYGHVGDRIDSADMMDELPVGTVVGEIGGGTTQWRKREDALWERMDGYAATYRSSQFAVGYNQIVSLPEGWSSRPRPKDTAARFMWRYRDGALVQAEAHGVAQGTVEQALAKMGAGRDAFPLGPGVTIRNNPTMNELPDGTVVYRGNPTTPAAFGVFVKRNGRWLHLLGESSGWNGSTVTVDSVNGDRTPVDWVAQEATEADEEAIRQFKARAWQVGYKLKRAQGWCSTYEAIVNALGITQEDLNNVTFQGVRVGDEVDPEEARMLPRGSLFRWQHRDYGDRFGVYMRVRNMDNRAGTRRVYGQTAEGLRLGHFKDRMTVVHIEQGDGINYRMRDPREWDLLPVGTEFAYNDNGVVYRIAQNGNATDRPMLSDGSAPVEGQWPRSDFRRGVAQIMVTGFPFINPNEERS